MHRINDSVLENGSTLLCLGLSFHIICNLPLCDYQRLFFKTNPSFYTSLSASVYTSCVFVCAGVDTVFFMSEFSYGRLPCGRPLMFQVCAYGNPGP